MEKKTIGKFIAVLRKANGMTQKELGNKLFVSDKTVSRWERDECAPELSLIPAIAEIFGITTDELLRGDKNNPDTPVADDTKPSAKAEKQFKAMMHLRMRKFKNLSLISVGLLFIGLLSAIVCNEVFLEAFLGFCISTLFLVASALCQICFSSNARIPFDEEDNTYTERISVANNHIVRISFVILYAIITVFLFCIPLAINGKNGGMWLEHWLLEGAVISAVTLSIFALIHLLFIKPILIKRKIYYVTKDKENKIRFRKKVLGKVTSVGGSVLVLLIVAIIVIGEIGILGFVKEEVYDSFEEFGNAMIEDHKEYIKFLREFETRVFYDDGNVVYTEPEIPDDHRLVHKKVTDFSGNVIFEYDYNTDLYKSIEFSFHSNRLPIKVISNDAYRHAKGIYNSILCSLLIAATIDIAACAAVYFIVAYGKKSKKI